MKLKSRCFLSVACALAVTTFLLLRSLFKEREAIDYNQKDSLRRAVRVGLVQHPDDNRSPTISRIRTNTDKSLQDKPGRTVSHDQPALHETTTARASLRKQVVNNPLHLSPWKLFQSWVTAEQLYTVDSLQSDAMIRILHAMSTQKIERVLVGYKGTQLKATFILAESQKVVFKPMRYSRDVMITGDPYAGYDRHNAEIAAFHLDGILGFRRAPPVAGRTVNLSKEVIPVSEHKLLKTFFKQNGNDCFYGVCYYCKKSDPACAKGTIMEGSVTLWLPDELKLKTWYHPWRRTYVKGKKARWEVDQTYCKLVQQQTLHQKGRRLLDILDTAIFDYLIGNADRHRFETFAKDGNNGMLLLLDNAKSFGNAKHDEWSILAPIYQCCMIRRSTWDKLLALSKGSKSLGALLKERTSVDFVAPVLTDEHFEAVNRRLENAINLINKCISKRGESVVLTKDYL
ncbi:glycosaminoglycan xylosylkinase-like [Corticium candelabrum]|uniref:glycosaminoglycan xylosylkinase-like n=1 Tax=Corticium candelabrum TaxID=121492 RepID=UPI002E253C71|nr:glycosaminoglycan xylosylkinase-like [Corticium candelabrum]